MAHTRKLDKHTKNTSSYTHKRLQIKKKEKEKTHKTTEGAKNKKKIERLNVNRKKEKYDKHYHINLILLCFL